jgi:hypothetical protein
MGRPYERYEGFFLMFLGWFFFFFAFDLFVEDVSQFHSLKTLFYALN